MESRVTFRRQNQLYCKSLQLNGLQSWRSEKILPPGLSCTKCGQPGIKSWTICLDHPKSLMGQTFAALWPTENHGTSIERTQLLVYVIGSNFLMFCFLKVTPFPQFLFSRCVIYIHFPIMYNHFTFVSLNSQCDLLCCSKTQKKKTSQKSQNTKKFSDGG